MVMARLCWMHCPNSLLRLWNRSVMRRQDAPSCIIMERQIMTSRNQ